MVDCFDSKGKCVILRKHNDYLALEVILTINLYSVEISRTVPHSNVGVCFSTKQRLRSIAPKDEAFTDPLEICDDNMLTLHLFEWKFNRIFFFKHSHYVARVMLCPAADITILSSVRNRFALFQGRKGADAGISSALGIKLVPASPPSARLAPSSSTHSENLPGLTSLSIDNPTPTRQPLHSEGSTQGMFSIARTLRQFPFSTPRSLPPCAPRRPNHTRPCIQRSKDTTTSDNFCISYGSRWSRGASVGGLLGIGASSLCWNNELGISG